MSFKKTAVLIMVALLSFTFVAQASKIDANAATNGASKKGIQGAEFLDDGDDLGVSHVLLNLDLSECIYTGSNGFPVYYNGKPYYYDSYVNHYMSTVRELNAKGISVTMVLLMSWSDDNKIKQLIYPGARSAGHTFYALNTVDADAREQLAALFNFIVKQYSDADCKVDNWIIGNEVNMPSAYNYTGTLDINTNVNICADSYLLLYNAIKEVGSDAKAYISLDHSWTHNDEGRGIAGKTFLDVFNTAIALKQPGTSWNLAYHPYPAIMDSTAHTYNAGIKYQETLLWGGNRYTANNVNAMFISTGNINVLTDYVRTNFGADKRIILSELGYDARYSETDQAAATAYAFYAGQFNDMIDAVIFRAYKDDNNDGSFKLGFQTNAMQKRPAYSVFKAMDTVYAEGTTNKYLSTIGASSWASLFSGYNLAAFSEQYVFKCDYDGVWKYFKNNKVYTEYTGYLEYNGSYFYIVNGILDNSITGIYNKDGNDIVLINGRWATECNGLMNVNGVWYYLVNGVVDKYYRGLVAYDGVWFYVANGVIDFSYNGLVSYDGMWFYVGNGMLDFSYCGLASYDGYWFYVTNGILDSNFSGMTNYMGYDYYIENGVICSWVSGLMYYNGTWYYLQNGVVDKNYNGLVEYGSAWFYVANGVIDWNYTGLASYAGMWFYVQNGILELSYTGFSEYAGYQFYVYNGVVYTDYTDLAEVNGGWRYIVNGIFQNGYTGLVNKGGIWYYVNNGTLDWGYTGLTEYFGTYFYVINGVLDWDYTGSVYFAGNVYNVIGGIVVM